MTVIPVNVSGIVDGQQIDAADVLTPLNDLKTAAQQIVDGGYDFLKTMWVDAVPLTIVADVLTITQTRHLVNNEAAAPTDQIATITGADVDMLLLQQGTGGQTTTLKHNTGNLFFESKRDYVLNDQNRIVVLYKNASTGFWSSINTNFGSLWLDDAVDGTIAAGVLTVQQSKTRMLPESSTSDDLDTITNPQGLDIIVLTVKTLGHTITVKHNTGNIFFDSGLDYIMSSQNQSLALVWNDTISKWVNFTTISQASISYVDQFNNAGSFDTLEVPAYAYTAGTPMRFESMPRFAFRRMFWDQAVVGTTFVTTGLTMANVGSLTGNAGAAGHFIQFLSAAVLNSGAHRRSNTIFQWRWSPTAEFRVGLCQAAGPAAGDNDPLWFGFMIGLPVVTAGPSVNYAGVSGIWVKSKTSGANNVAGQVWSAGVKLGEVNFYTGTPNWATGVGVAVIRIYIDGIGNNVVFEVDGVRSSVLNIPVPGGLSTIAMDLFAGLKAPTAASYQANLGVMYAEQA